MRSSRAFVATEPRRVKGGGGALVPVVVGAFYFAIVGAAFALAGPDGLPRRLSWEEAAEEVSEASRDGAALFEKYCAACHGPEGDGQGHLSPFLAPRPRDFTQAILKFRTNPEGRFPRDEDLFRSVTVGFPAHGMPAFDALTTRDRWALVAEVKRLARAGLRARLLEKARAGDLEPEEVPEILDLSLQAGPPLEIPEVSVEEPVASRRGEEMYRRFGCAACHGARGRGDGPAAPTLRDPWGEPAPPGNLRAGPRWSKTGCRPRDIVRILRIGIPGTPMPAFVAGGASEWEDLWCLASFVAGLSDEADEAQ